MPEQNQAFSTETLLKAFRLSLESRGGLVLRPKEATRMVQHLAKEVGISLTEACTLIQKIYRDSFNQMMEEFDKISE